MAAFLDRKRRLDWRTYKVAEADQTGTNDGGSIADVANGIQGTVPASVASADPSAGQWAAWKILDRLNEDAVQSLMAVQVQVLLHEITAPDLSSDVILSVGVADEADLTTATASANGSVYAGASRKLRTSRIVTGSVQAGNDSTADAGIRYCYGTYNLGAVSILNPSHVFAVARDSNGDAVSGVNCAVFNVNWDSNTDLYFYVAFHRDAMTAGEETPVVVPWVYALPAPFSGVTPSL